MAYQAISVEVEGGLFSDSGEKTSEIQESLDQGSAKGWKLVNCIQTFSTPDLKRYLLIWDTQN